MIQSWPKGITYQVFVQSFFDGNGDGIGDLVGLTNKLDYLKRLGAEALWLMPIHPSPSYHKYDVTNYYGIHPDYGELKDFKELIDAAHGVGLKILIDLVISHCSNQHEWFLEAQKGKSNPFRNYFVWANDEEIEAQGGLEKKKISEDSDNIIQWHEVEEGDEKYLGYFWEGMPNLNHDHEPLREELIKIGRFWLAEMGVDGFRLDAVKHNYPEDRAEDSHRFWNFFREEMQKINPKAHLVGEIWDDPEVIYPYLDSLGSAFNFNLGDAIIESINNEKGVGLMDVYQSIQNVYAQATRPYIDATFIANHDQERAISALEENETKARMAASLLLTLPGSPYLYYGEELGMTGKKPDPNIRTPFPWTNDPEMPGQTNWTSSDPPQTARPLDLQMVDERSIFNHYRKLIDCRRNSKALSLGNFRSIPTQWEELSIFERSHEEETLLIIHNHSGKTLGIMLGAGYEDYEVKLAMGGCTIKNRLLELVPLSSLILNKP